MKIKDDYILREIAGEFIAVPVGSRTKELHGYIVLNETGAFLWKQLNSSQTYDTLISALLAEYDVSYNEAMASVKDFEALLSSENLLDSH